MDEEQESGKGKKIVKVVLILFLLLVLIIGGFAIGIYLRIFDAQAANESLGLYKLPILGEYFVKPAPTQDEMENQPIEDARPEAKDKKDKSKKLTLTKEEIEKQMKEREAAEKKRVSKLARLYNQMKPKDAAAAMDPLDDDLILLILQRMDESNAAKVLTQFEPQKTARLTQMLYEGTKKRVLTAADIEKQMQEEQAAENGGAGQDASASAQNQ
ncbi:MAG: magnesium transporter MgtE N-terminal domain-containing protein [Mitsuokella sp.]